MPRARRQPIRLSCGRRRHWSIVRRTPTRRQSCGAGDRSRARAHRRTNPRRRRGGPCAEARRPSGAAASSRACSDLDHRVSPSSAQTSAVMQHTIARSSSVTQAGRSPIGVQAWMFRPSRWRFPIDERDGGRPCLKPLAAFCPEARDPGAGQAPGSRRRRTARRGYACVRPLSEPSALGDGWVVHAVAWAACDFTGHMTAGEEYAQCNGTYHHANARDVPDAL